jgi:hypothetical protein
MLDLEDRGMEQVREFEMEGPRRLPTADPHIEQQVRF